MVKVSTRRSSIASRWVKNCLGRRVTDQPARIQIGKTKRVSRRKIMERPSAPRVKVRL